MDIQDNQEQQGNEDNKSELKQRLIGAVVVTALAAIFVPMLFDDPAETSNQQVSELTVPKAPAHIDQTVQQQFPDNFGQALTPERPSTPANAATNLAEDNTPNKVEAPADDNAVLTEDLIATETEDKSVPAKTVAKTEATETAETTELSTSSDADMGEDETSKKTSDETPKANITPHPIKKKTPVSENTSNKESKVDSKPKKPTEKTTGFGRWSIQAGSFSKKENADAMLAKLRKQGFPVSLQQSKNGLYRLKIGPELDKRQAAEMKKKLDGQGIQSLLMAE